MSELTTERVDRGSTAVLRLSGRAGADAAAALDGAIDTLIEEKPQRIVLDLGGLTYMSSYGIGALVRLANAVGKKDDGATIRIAGASSEIIGVLEQSRLDARFPLYATVDQATA